MAVHTLPSRDVARDVSKAKPKSLLEVMDAIAGGHFDFEPPRMDGEFKPVSFD